MNKDERRVCQVNGVANCRGLVFAGIPRTNAAIPRHPIIRPPRRLHLGMPDCTTRLLFTSRVEASHDAPACLEPCTRRDSCGLANHLHVSSAIYESQTTPSLLHFSTAQTLVMIDIICAKAECIGYSLLVRLVDTSIRYGEAYLRTGSETYVHTQLRYSSSQPAGFSAHAVVIVYAPHH